MLIRVRKKSDVASSEITPKDVYVNRREFLGRTGGAIAAAGLVPSALPGAARRLDRPQEAHVAPPADFGEELRSELNPYRDVTQYNNFYEFGTAKDDPFRYSGDFEPRPWTVEVGGLCHKPGTYGVEDLVGMGGEIEDRIYRMRCVEAWSMVIPWRGVPLRNVISRLEPMTDARFVAFETVYRPEQMPGQERNVLDWPYVEGLRIDEAANELSLLVTGLYGEDLPNQNGAPLRLVTPWKYGFKGIKSIVRITFTDEMPPTSWNIAAPHEYGFYANVNPNVDHPRWSQARERYIGKGLGYHPTLMFNGYGEEVGHLYAGMDLREWY
jgi:sulfoxide reductase catalytic subunit YedY